MWIFYLPDKFGDALLFRQSFIHRNGAYVHQSGGIYIFVHMLLPPFAHNATSYSQVGNSWSD